MLTGPELQRGQRDTKAVRCLRSRFPSEQIGGSQLGEFHPSQLRRIQPNLMEYRAFCLNAVPIQSNRNPNLVQFILTQPNQHSARPSPVCLVFKEQHLP